MGLLGTFRVQRLARPTGPGSHAQLIAVTAGPALGIAGGAVFGFAGELAAGIALAFGLARRRALVAPALALTVLVALAVAVTEDGVRDALRLAGRNGA